MRALITLAATACLASAALAQTTTYPPGNPNAPLAGARNGGGGGAALTPEQRAQRKQARQAKLAAMTPAQRQAHDQKRAARQAARMQQPAGSTQPMGPTPTQPR